MKRLCSIISWVFHPLWMPFFLFLELALHAPDFLGPTVPKITLSIMILILTGALPAFNLIIFKILGTIPNLHLSERRDRIMPFMFITMVYAGVAYLFYGQYAIPSAVKLLIIIATVSLAGTLLTLLIKISVHALAISSVATALIIIEGSSYGGELFWPSFVTVIASGLAMSARLYLGAHSLKEIGLGALTGITIAGSGMVILF